MNARDEATIIRPAGSARPAFRHWRLERGADGLATLVLDREGASTNTLSAEVLAELNGALDLLERDKPRALVVRSG